MQQDAPKKTGRPAGSRKNSSLQKRSGSNQVVHLFQIAKDLDTKIDRFFANRYKQGIPIPRVEVVRLKRKRLI